MLPRLKQKQPYFYLIYGKRTVKIPPSHWTCSTANWNGFKGESYGAGSSGRTAWKSICEHQKRSLNKPKKQKQDKNDNKTKIVPRAAAGHHKAGSSNFTFYFLKPCEAHNTTSRPFGLTIDSMRILRSTPPRCYATIRNSESKLFPFSDSRFKFCRNSFSCFLLF